MKKPEFFRFTMKHKAQNIKNLQTPASAKSGAGVSYVYANSNR
jgi:hypothetical protein